MIYDNGKTLTQGISHGKTLTQGISQVTRPAHRDFSRYQQLCIVACSSFHDTGSPGTMLLMPYAKVWTTHLSGK